MAEELALLDPKTELIISDANTMYQERDWTFNHVENYINKDK